MKPATLAVAGVTILLLSAGGATAATDLVDLDGDGRPVIEELRAGTDPLDADSDDDGLRDAVEREYGTDPLAADTDGDGLADGRELEEYGTDPTVADTDGDGFTDGEEVTLERTLPGADPTRVDIYVEVDYMSEPGLTDAEIERLEQTFADAPVENPDGSTGISLHVQMDEQVPTKSPVALSGESEGHPDLELYSDTFFDHRNQGYRYALVADRVTLDNRTVGGAAWVGEDSFLLRQYTWQEHLTGSTFLHELGHSLGLSHHPGGADTRPFESYPSAMNYNKPNDFYGFSAGNSSTDDIDEWAEISEGLAETIPDTSELPE